MRFTRYTPLAILICTGLLAPVPAPAAASKEMMDLQRDVAGIKQQVQDLQKALLDPKTGTITGLQTMIQQALDTANKTNSNVNNLNKGMMDTLQNALKGMNDQLGKVTDLSVRINNMAETDIPNLESSLQALQVTVNKQGAKLDEILNQVKLLQPPPAAAPPPDASTGAPVGAPVGAAPQASPQTLFDNAVRDQNSGKLDLALTEYQQFLRLFPDDPNAIGAQYNIGNIYYSQGKLDEAVMALDAVIEQYPKNEVTTPSAYYMKGMALKKEKKNTSAIASFNAVVRDFPHSEEADQAKQQLRSLGVATSTTAKKPAH